MLHLAGCCVGEGHRHDLIERSASRFDHRNDAADEFAGLACAGGSLDYQRGVQVIANLITRRLIGEVFFLMIAVRTIDFGRSNTRSSDRESTRLYSSHVRNSY